ncbi:hypothetical protein DSECCO2_526930 [anaerobic digester metagenome]
MPGIEKETVAHVPGHIRRIIPEVFRVKNMYKIGSAHRATGMPRPGLLNHCCRKDADVIGSQSGKIFAHELLL